VRRIEAVEKDLKALGDSSATKEDISRVRAEVKKLYDGLHVGKWTCHWYLVPYSSLNDRIFGFANTCLGHSYVIETFENQFRQLTCP